MRGRQTERRASPAHAAPRRGAHSSEARRDLARGDRSKGVIVLDHAISEEPGMKICAEWLKTFIADVPVELIPAGDPFW
jgi:hypothetical protein